MIDGTGCSSLKGVTIPTTVTFLGYAAFDGRYTQFGNDMIAYFVAVTLESIEIANLMQIAEPTFEPSPPTFEPSSPTLEPSLPPTFEPSPPTLEPSLPPTFEHSPPTLEPSQPTFEPSSPLSTEGGDDILLQQFFT